MRIYLKFPIIALLFLFGCQKFTAEELAFTIQQARQSGSPIPLVTEIVPRLTADEAYYIQNAWLEKNLIENTLYGFKAGVTSKAAQQEFGMNEPVGGLLLESDQIFPGDTLYVRSMLKPKLELEFGFEINDYLSEPIQNLDTLRAKVSHVFVMVEIPDIGFEDIRPFNAADLIAANVGVAHFIADSIGFSVNDRDWNKQKLKMFRDGALLFEGQGSDALENQWKALQWLVNNFIQRGYVIGKGQVLITGALGPMGEAEPGFHEVFLNEQKRFDFYLK